MMRNIFVFLDPFVVAVGWLRAVCALGLVVSSFTMATVIGALQLWGLYALGLFVFWNIYWNFSLFSVGRGVMLAVELRPDLALA